MFGGLGGGGCSALRFDAPSTPTPTQLQVNEVATSGPPAADAPVRPISVRLAIPNSQAGAIIGKAGSKVKVRLFCSRRGVS